MFTISKRFDFSAAHHLNGLPSDHPCLRAHGHNYSVTMVLESTLLDPVGFVMDYRALDSFKRWIDEGVDHRDLNEVFAPMNPTAENLARHFFERARSLFGPVVCSVSVKETEKTLAEYRP